MNGMVVGLKTNCSALLSSAAQAFSAQTACLDVLTETDKRKITRETAVISVNSSNLPKIWQKSVVDFIRVKRCGIRAKKAATVCQGHWSIEGLYRFKDVQFNEDKNRIKNKNVASALSQIFNYTLNIFTFTGQKSVKIAIETLADNITALFDMVATTKNYQPS